MKSKYHFAKKVPTKSQLKTAVEETDDVKGHFKEGIKAVEGRYRNKFVVLDSWKLTGSIDIDSATKEKYFEDNRWDYAIEYDGETFFVEIHPGSTSEVETVILKLNWLKKWLNIKAPKIKALQPRNKKAFYWLFTNRFAILPTSKQYKRLSLQGIVPQGQWVYNEIK